MTNSERIVGHLSDQIRADMEVLGSDGRHVGIVDHPDGAGKIKLTKADSNSSGKHHFISYDWVDHVDQRVHLNKPTMRLFCNGRTSNVLFCESARLTRG
jgi:hypothetical protein